MLIVSTVDNLAILLRLQPEWTCNKLEPASPRGGPLSQKTQIADRRVYIYIYMCVCVSVCVYGDLYYSAICDLSLKV